MAYISQRGKYWRAEVRRRGYKPVYRSFDTKQKAQQWARRVESEMDSAAYVDRTEAERTTLRQALERYRREIVPEKRHPYQENRRIQRWIDNDLSHRTLANLRGADFAKYRDERRAAGRAENTIRLELQVISHLFEIARKEWGMEALTNPLKNIRKPSGSEARDRRLRPGEFEMVHARLSASGNLWAALAFELAIETSLRQGLSSVCSGNGSILHVASFISHRLPVARRTRAYPLSFRCPAEPSLSSAILQLSQKARRAA